MFKFRVLALAAGAALCMMAAPASARVTRTDIRFVNAATQGGIAEVDAARLAIERGIDPNVRAFAQRMIMDHTKLNRDLGQIAAREGLTTPVSLDAQDQAGLNRLAAFNGAAFDRAYAQQQLSAHDSAIALFKTEANRGGDPALRQFAAGTLPMLISHRDRSSQVVAALIPTQSRMAHRGMSNH